MGRRKKRWSTLTVCFVFDPFPNIPWENEYFLPERHGVDNKCVPMVMEAWDCPAGATAGENTHLVTVEIYIGTSDSSQGKWDAWKIWVPVFNSHPFSINLNCVCVGPCNSKTKNATVVLSNVHDALPSSFFPIHLAKGADLLSESLLVENYWCCPFYTHSFTTGGPHVQWYYCFSWQSSEFQRH